MCSCLEMGAWGCTTAAGLSLVILFVSLYYSWLRQWHAPMQYASASTNTHRSWLEVLEAAEPPRQRRLLATHMCAPACVCVCV
jgi:ABC-type Fe3+ transport system permease subunit